MHFLAKVWWIKLQAYTGGKDFKDGSLKIQWYNRQSHLNSEKDDSQAEITAQDLLATLDDEDDVWYWAFLSLKLGNR